jgi:hypothetical protein
VLRGWDREEVLRRARIRVDELLLLRRVGPF